jgi:hypothetical protein
MPTIADAVLGCAAKGPSMVLAATVPPDNFAAIVVGDLFGT